MIGRSVILGLVLVAGFVHAAEPPGRAYTEAFAAMRDQVRLAANIYLPDGEGPWPVIVTRTPYLKDNER